MLMNRYVIEIFLFIWKLNLFEWKKKFIMLNKFIKINFGLILCIK